MDAPGLDLTAAVAIVFATLAAVALPLLTLRRLRTPERRRDAWLSANAQPVLTMAAHIVGIISAVVCGCIGALIGVGLNITSAWALVPLSVGLVASTIITVVLTFRTPTDIDQSD